MVEGPADASLCWKESQTVGQGLESSANKTASWKTVARYSQFRAVFWNRFPSRFAQPPFTREVVPTRHRLSLSTRERLPIRSSVLRDRAVRATDSAFCDIVLVTDTLHDPSFHPAPPVPRSRPATGSALPEIGLAGDYTRFRHAPLPPHADARNQHRGSRLPALGSRRRPGGLHRVRP